MKVIETRGCTALALVERPVERSNAHFRGSRPDAPFVTQLIATAAADSQTCRLRRATQADALKDYGCTAARKFEQSQPNGIRVSLVA
jgi:hypothetical protein